MWVRFLAEFSFAVTPAVSYSYKPNGGPFQDGRYLVKRKCAAAAIKAGKAERCERPEG